MFFESRRFKVHHRFGACEIKEVVCFFVMLDDCRISFDVRLVQRSNIVENLSQDVRELEYS
jgi:hypothetical protein